MLIPYMMLGMAMGRVRGGFFYTQTRPAGPHPLPEPSPFNKQVFFYACSNSPRRIWAQSTAQIMAQ